MYNYVLEVLDFARNTALQNKKLLIHDSQDIFDNVMMLFDSLIVSWIEMMEHHNNNYIYYLTLNIGTILPLYLYNLLIPYYPHKIYHIWSI